MSSMLVIVALAAASDLMETPNGLWSATSLAITRFGYLGGFLLSYIEESGIPLLIPGDVFLVYVGHRLPSNLLAWMAAWSGFIVAVVLGSMNLYLLSRRLGRRVLAHPLARFLHLTPERLTEADRHFRRWGPWTIIVGRHIPGFRVPITVAAGVLGMDFLVFILSVTISSAVWAALFLAVGVVYGESAVRLLHAPATYAVLPAILCVVGVWALRRHLTGQMGRVTGWVISIWRPRRLAATHGNVPLAIACEVALVGVFVAEYWTETALRRHRRGDPRTDGLVVAFGTGCGRRDGGGVSAYRDAQSDRLVRHGLDGGRGGRSAGSRSHGRPRLRPCTDEERGA